MIFLEFLGLTLKYFILYSIMINSTIIICQLLFPKSKDSKKDKGD